MRRRSLAISVALTCGVVLGVVAAARTHGDQAGDTGQMSRGELAMPGESAPWGISLPSTRARAPYTIGGIPLCIRSKQPATIERIKATGGSGDIRVTNFLVRPLSADLFGAEQVRLSDAGVTGGHRVEVSCAGEPGGAELVVEMQKSRADNARMAGLSVSYSTADGKGFVNVPLHLVLCQGADQDSPECVALAQ